jgi:hypothetical protein
MEKDVEGSCGLMKGRPINTVNLSGNYTYHLVYNSEECTYWYRMSFRIRSHCLPQQQKPQDLCIQWKNPGHVPGTEKTQEHSGHPVPGRRLRPPAGLLTSGATLVQSANAQHTAVCGRA